MAVSVFVKPFLDYLRTKSYWSALEPVLVFASLYVGACVLGYEYLQSRFAGYSPEFAGVSLRLLTLFLHSYIFKQISLAAAALALATILVAVSMRSESTKLKTPQWIGWARAHGAALARTAALLVLIAGVTVPAFRWLAPRNVGDIQILFLDDPGDAFAQPALTYLLYELNARQSRWHFDVNFDVFNPRAHVDVMEGCEGEVRVMLCHAERMAAGEPLIALTTHPLEQSHFSENRGNVSVITTDDWDAPPTVYEYLTYSIILESIHIHLNTACPALPSTSFQESRVGIGDLFEFAPRRYAMKPAILAAHISPGQEIMLMNCFGADYVDTASQLIKLGWLRSDPVKRNLEANFGVKIATAAASE
ncbi:MAG: hypothetical protein DMF87_06790 [Acidobacteria bacterium]|nr:MAG: hypothetical protein DMF88_26860 [Acidobacteriota bacterium]PYR81006.1 MAG: hypothetical protein DMF87_06790 [Acidobacteriota bacterium]